MISVLIIAKDSADVIGDAIRSVKNFADEVIVVDGGSGDSTVDIAGKLGARVVKNPFRDFSDQRNLAASLARNEWIFYLDADEKATPEFSKKIEEVIDNADPETAGFYVRRKTHYLGKDWGFYDKVQRVFKKEKLKKWYGVVHETPEVEGKLGVINEPILHFTHRNLEQMVEKTNFWSDYEADLRYKANHPKMNVFRFARVMATGFLRSYVKEKGYRNGTAGFIESIYQAFSMFITYAKLWEKHQKN